MGVGGCRYPWCVRYADGGGLTPTGRQRRETVRMQAAGLFEQQIAVSEVARRLRVSVKSAYQWHQLWRDGGVEALASRVRAGHGAVCRRGASKSWRGSWEKGRPRMAGWRTRCGPHQGWPR
ncbi:helix-turn-helix domain-containing protein [Streptomyces sp. NPDC051366]|uniref:helix-turn-helix domain-containing protein n=1 Tax=Streptomyces sp. NPDC051366 TaxID=3365652 RepID=UPI003788068D